MGAYAQAGRDFGGGQHGGNGEAAAQAFGAGEDVWRYVVHFVGVQVAGAAYATLNFVEDQQGVVFVAELSQPLQEFGICRHDAAFALDRLDHDSAGFLFGDQRFY